MINPQLLKCDQCSRIMQTNIYLGSLTSQGDIIMKQHKSLTCIQATEFTLIHDCGFTIKITSGIVQPELSPQITHG